MKLKDYTTTVEAAKSISEIEEILAAFGATTIMKEYLADGKVYSLSFKFQEKGFKLPANVDGVKKILYEGKRVRHTTDGAKNRDEQAYRVSWRVIKDWLHSQLSLILSGQAEPEQVLFPYMYNGKQTLWERYRTGQLQLEEGDKDVKFKDEKEE